MLVKTIQQERCHQRKRILLVDDDWLVGETIREILELFHFHVDFRTDPVDALNLFRREPDCFDLVITDMMMPGMTGDILAVEFMKIRQDIPVILCTGFSHLISKERAKSLGISKYLDKPITREMLATSVREVLDSKKRGTISAGN
jgi:CheY-like chemotaxis protein